MKLSGLPFFQDVSCPICGEQKDLGRGCKHFLGWTTDDGKVWHNTRAGTSGTVLLGDYIVNTFARTTRVYRNEKK